MVWLSTKQRSLVCIYASVLIDQLGAALTLPIMAYYVEHLGGTPTAVGAVMSTFAIGQIVSSLWMGAASDRYGRRPIILLSLAGSSAGLLASAVVPNYESLFLARLFLGLFSGSMPAANAYLTDICPPQDVPKRMALLAALAGLAFVVGPPVGSALSAVSLKFPFVAGATTSALALLLAFRYLRTPDELERETAAESAPSRVARRKSTRQALTSRTGDRPVGPALPRVSRLVS